jgi:putative MFS transporter
MIPIGKDAWRWMFGIAAVPALIVLTIRQFLPESPRWLINHNQPEKAREVIAGFGMEVPESAYGASANQGNGTIKEVFGRKTIVTTLIVVGVFFFNCLGTSSSTVAVPYIVHFEGFSVRGSLGFSAVLFGCDIVGLLIGFLLIDRIPRRRLGMMSAGATAIFTVLIATVGVHSHTLLLAFFILLAISAWSGITVLVWVWPELFPTRIRARGQGLSNSTCRIGTGSAVFLVPPLLAATGFSVTVLLYAVPLVILFFIILSARRLDTTGRTLEEISS